MPLLIDGNNLMYALGTPEMPVDRAELCELLSPLAARERDICVVFDGRTPQEPNARYFAECGMEVIFSGLAKADGIILQRISASTAPRRLTVVSSDREIRREARRRRCKSLRSDEFADVLYRAADREARRPPPEPPEKRHGLTSAQTRAWLREFGLADPDDREK